MAQNSAIEWTDATWNPIRGCTRISEGCRNCYAERIAYRFSRKGAAPYRGLVKITNKRPQWTGVVRLVPEMLEIPLKRRQPTKFFVNSMSDLFHEKVPVEFIDKIYAVIGLAKKHTFQILTKRPERALEYFESRNQEWAAKHFLELPGLSVVCDWVRRGIERAHNGVSVEDQPAADKRIPIALQWPIGKGLRWISAEPLLGRISLLGVPVHHAPPNSPPDYCSSALFGDPRIDWVVAGGESGPGARPMHPGWARLLRDDCVSFDIPFFFKQWGQWAPFADKPKAGDICVMELPDNPYNRRDTEGQPERYSEWNRDLHGGADGTVDRMGSQLMRKLGKKKSGRLLDGKEWNQYPEAK